LRDANHCLMPSSRSLEPLPEFDCSEPPFRQAVLMEPLEHKR
jgi:hypothetical protein